jgi:hypothetical protein
VCRGISSDYFAGVSIKHPLALLALLLALPVFAGITIKADLNFDGGWDTVYRAGDKPIGGGDTCLSGWTCATFGTGSGQFDDQSASAINITATTPGDEDGIAAVYKTFAMETNRHLAFRVTGITGNQDQYAGCGAFISDDDADFSTPDYKDYGWLPVVGSMRFKSAVGGATELGQFLAGGIVGHYGGLEYNATTNTTTGWYSADNVTWFQIGTAVSHTFSAGRYGFFATSANAVASTTCSLTTIADSTTLSFVDGGSAPTLLFDEDFESATWYTDNPWGNGTNIGPIANPGSLMARDCDAGNGVTVVDGCALQVTVASGTHLGSNLGIYLSRLGYEPSFGEGVYLKYQQAFGTTWDQAMNGKMPGFSGPGGGCGFGGCPVDGNNGWSSRGKYGEACSGDNPIIMANYVYHADMPSEFGATFSWSGYHDCAANQGFVEGTWYTVCQYIQMNSGPYSGATMGDTDGTNMTVRHSNHSTGHDGIMRAWVNGTQVRNTTDVLWDYTGNFPITRAWFNIYHGGGLNAPQNMHVYFDNVQISETAMSGCGV